MRTKEEERKLRATYKYCKPITISVDGPLGCGRTGIMLYLHHCLEQTSAIIFKQTGEYVITLEVPNYRKKGK